MCTSSGGLLLCAELRVMNSKLDSMHAYELDVFLLV